jgi:hypothetical protein
MHGTEDLEQAVTDWPALVSGRTVPEQARFKELTRSTRATTVVGHSLGASWASSLAETDSLHYRGYGRPGFGRAVPGDVQNLGDPVTWLTWGPHRPRLGHSLHAYSR